MDQYQYSTLEPTEKKIRLLLVERGERHRPIKCWLFDSYPDEEKGVSYKALSYTWGTTADGWASQTRAIDVSGHRFMVTENLYSALLEIRSAYEDVRLWVDSICINQNDKQEKGHQVKQMGDIYEGAEEVLIWLGPKSDGTTSLLELITWIESEAKNARALGTEEDWASLCGRLMERRFRDPNVDALPTQHKALQRLLERPWFSRVWILQEVAKARKATIMCGSGSCPARTFALMPSLMGLEVPDHTQVVLDIMPQIRKSTWWSSQRTLHSLLVKFRESQATLPRDKIYALLGMSEDASDPEKFFPCYEKDDDQVIRDTLSFVLLGEILDPRSHLFPPATLLALSHPISLLAGRTLDWCLSQIVGYMPIDCARRTARRLSDRMNEGQLPTRDILLPLIRVHPKLCQDRLLRLLNNDSPTQIVLHTVRHTIQLILHSKGEMSCTLPYPKGSWLNAEPEGLESLL